NDQKYKGHRFNSPASTTPAVDEKRVVFSWGTPEKLTMAAFSHDGKKLWQTDLGPISGGHGFAASPMLLGDLVILNNDQEKGGGNLLALDANTGKVKWTVERRSQRISYSVPCVIDSDGRKLLAFVNWQHGFTIIDPKDGSVVAEKSVFNTKVNERAISSPLVYKDMIIGTCGFTANPKHCVAMRLKGNELEEVWRIERNVPHIPSPVVVGDKAYLWDDAGIVTCVEAATGKEVWKGRVPGVEGNCFGSPVSDGKNIFCSDESGNINVIAVGGELKHLATNKLGELCRTTPAIGDGAMYVRTYKKLVAVEGNE
ncbi:MAG: PQQ-binding-like beta-propeller repeat protein, partial [Verrucomicrobia bacterium]|nr:PQQ-binding-like beta-propeller repeat protein [Verrucomicrobiota bacterium]